MSRSTEKLQEPPLFAIGQKDLCLTNAPAPSRSPIFSRQANEAFLANMSVSMIVPVHAQFTAILAVISAFIERFTSTIVGHSLFCAYSAAMCVSGMISWEKTQITAFLTANRASIAQNLAAVGGRIGRITLRSPQFFVGGLAGTA